MAKEILIYGVVTIVAVVAGNLIYDKVLKPKSNSGF